MEADQRLSVLAATSGLDSDDEVSLDASFFLNENYQLQTFTFDTESIELYCLQSSLTDYDLTGQLVWPGAELLAEYLLQRRSQMKGLSVIELGAGLGLTGLLCARLCEHVVITDYNDTILKVMQMNVDHQVSTGALPVSSAEVQKLDWSVDEHLDSILEKHPQGFDLVMGADICYQRSYVPLLFRTIRRLLNQQKPGSAALLGYVSRWRSMDTAVCVEAAKLDLDIKEVPGTRKPVVSGVYEGWIYEITAKL
ncbi:hypothetical protein MPTK1_1g19660 [Marchantia polymorpha subsp. ruderalis]|uniref:Calmodulin-lysine N-methyltransferase n=2 Tax=Marchantia polymorpha TaxID=3197 RepID=A0AAF6ARZ8_MARPO|nr:hypothetical protein MARPO_0001s0305 [Marchantia polymorpha]BBM99218.1 hypothetical protein Mp_1g19660 [Marchantia polymorpha subsp. ruderalis]|eukprot:PTQ50301.1 hypothetical protein MARPO_0001s0305 [Marchantia polymorpha]